jgi:hypothetical protein
MAGAGTPVQGRTDRVKRDELVPRGRAAGPRVTRAQNNEPQPSTLVPSATGGSVLQSRSGGGQASCGLRVVSRGARLDSVKASGLSLLERAVGELDGVFGVPLGDLRLVLDMFSAEVCLGLIVLVVE